jgi:hypothetical protein
MAGHLQKQIMDYHYVNEMNNGKAVLQTVVFSSSVELYLPEQPGASKDVDVS